jgi:hypothetical protein
MVTQAARQDWSAGQKRRLCALWLSESVEVVARSWLIRGLASCECVRFQGLVSCRIRRRLCGVSCICARVHTTHGTRWFRIEAEVIALRFFVWRARPLRFKSSRQPRFKSGSQWNFIIQYRLLPRRSHQRCKISQSRNPSTSNGQRCTQFAEPQAERHPGPVAEAGRVAA